MDVNQGDDADDTFFVVVVVVVGLIAVAVVVVVSILGVADINDNHGGCDIEVLLLKLLLWLFLLQRRLLFSCIERLSAYRYSPVVRGGKGGGVHLAMIIPFVSSNDVDVVVDVVVVVVVVVMHCLPLRIRLTTEEECSEGNANVVVAVISNSIIKTNTK